MTGASGTTGVDGKTTGQDKKISPFVCCLKVSFDRAKPITALYSVYALICTILGILLALSMSNAAFFKINIMMSSVYTVLKNVDMLGLAAGLISAVWFFSKYTNHCSNNLIKSLPAKDKHLFLSDFIMGFVSFLVPIIIGFTVQSVAGIILTSYDTSRSIYETMGISFGFILNFLFGYCVAVFCFSVTSGVLESIIAFVVLNFIPSIISSFVVFAKTCVLGLFELEANISLKLEIRSTFDVICRGMIDDKKRTYYTTYADMLKVSLIIIAVSAAVTLLAYFAFVKLRSPDKSGSRTKKIISVVTVCALSFYCGFLILFFKRTRITAFNMMAIIPTMIAISFIVFYLANTINLKNFRVPLKSFVPYVPVVALLALIGTYYFTAGFGAAKYIPEADKVASVTLNYSDSSYTQTVEEMKASVFTQFKFLAQKDVQVEFPITYEDSGSISSITDYHKALLEKYESHGLVETAMQGDNHFPADNAKTIITYKLKSGKTVTRYYNYNGNEEILAKLSTLDLVSNSISESEARAIKFMNGKPDESINHSIMISPICSDNDFTNLQISDAQLRQLIKAIYQDELNKTDEDIVASEGGDICALVIVPNDKTNSGYFAGMMKNINGTLFRTVIKSCYTNTEKVLRSIAGASAIIDSSKDANVKQILAGSFGTAIKGSGYYSQYYSYNFEQIYSFDYTSAQRIYNTDKLDPSETPLIDGLTCNGTAINYLLSKLKLSGNDINSGVAVMMNSSIESYGVNDEYVAWSEWHMAIGKRVYYVTADEWNTFLQMCNQ